MDVTTIGLLTAGLLVMIGLYRSIRLVPQATRCNVERLGRYRTTLRPGLNFVVPVVDRIADMIDMREQVIAFPPQPVRTGDNLLVQIDSVVYFQVVDPRAAAYEVGNFITAIEQVTLTALCNIVGNLELTRLLHSRDEINAQLLGVLDETTGKWGVQVNRVELKGVDIPKPLQDAIERQVDAEFQDRAAALHAEGKRRASLPEVESAGTIAGRPPRDDAAARREAVPGNTTGSRSRHTPLNPEDPRRVGRYNVTARLGQGGMGTVYLGHSPGGRLVAVKVIHEGLAADPEFRRRFGREIEAARRVGGFHTAPLVDADPDCEPPWLATEYLPGPTLREILQQHEALPVRSLLTLAAGMAEALEHIHACGIIHRDLKPSNILVTESGPRVIDFGIARALDSTALTRTDHVVGTRGFLAPEQLTGTSATFATDVYAYGMVLCHASGAAPFADGEPLQSELSLLPSRLADLVSRCLDHDPSARPTATAILEQLSPSNPLSGDWLPLAVRDTLEMHTNNTIAET